MIMWSFSFEGPSLFNCNHGDRTEVGKEHRSVPCGDCMMDDLKKKVFFLDLCTFWVTVEGKAGSRLIKIMKYENADVFTVSSIVFKTLYFYKPHDRTFSSFFKCSTTKLSNSHLFVFSLLPLDELCWVASCEKKKQIRKRNDKRIKR